MNQVETEAIAVLRDLMKSDVETVRLHAAVAILQYGELIDASPATGEPDSAGDSPSSAPAVVRATRFELVDAGGKVLAVLGELAKHRFDSDAVGPGIGLALFDKDGQPQVRLCASNHDDSATSQGLTVFDLSGEYRVNVGASQGGGGISAEHGSSSKCELFVGFSSPILRFFDNQENERVLLAVSGQSGDPSFQLKAGDGSSVFSAP